MWPTRNPLKEPFSAVSHLLGAVLSTAGLVTLLFVEHGRTGPTIAVTIYGLSLVLLYTLSAIYHSLHVSPEMEKHLQRLDHMAIFLLIAGTYTPVCLITLKAGWGWALFSAVWGMAALGIFTVLVWKTHPHWIRVTLYVLMGWLAVAVLPAMFRHLGSGGIAWMVAGGLAYTLGIYFYARDTARLPWCKALTGHEIWHLFVLGGSVCHFVLIWRFVAPGS